MIIKRDKKIRRNPAEMLSFITNDSRAFLLGGNETKFGMLRSLMVAWGKIEHIVETETAPYIYFIFANGKVDRRYP